MRQVPRHATGINYFSPEPSPCLCAALCGTMKALRCPRKKCLLQLLCMLCIYCNLLGKMMLISVWSIVDCIDFQTGRSNEIRLKCFGELLNTTVVNVGKKAPWKYNARQTRLYFPKYTLRLAVNVCFIMVPASKCAAVHILSHFAKLPTPPCSGDQ